VKLGTRRFAVALIGALALAVSVAPARAGSVIYVPAVDTPWPGKIFVAHDEWAISDYGYQLTRTSATGLTLNVARFFTGGRPGRFLAYSDFYGLVGHEIAATMTAAGHAWTVDTTVPFTLDTLLQYDAVFVGGAPVPDNDVLIEYVRAGGGVFVEGGTGLGGNVWEAQHWAEFLNAFGLAYASDYDLTRTPGIYPIVSASPLFAGVAELYEEVGNPVLLLDPSDPYTRNLVPYNGHALYATYSTNVVPVTVEICLRLSSDGDDRLWTAIIGAGGFDVRTIDLRSIRLVGVAAPSPAWIVPMRHSLPSPQIGRAGVDHCRLGPTRSLDLVLGFHSRDVRRAAEALLGHPLEDGDLVALTLTGRLKPQFGGTPIVGESVVSVKGPKKRSGR
jgi:hypothetical protein